MAGGVRTGMGIGFGLILALLVFLVGCPALYFAGCLTTIGLVGIGATKVHEDIQYGTTGTTTQATEVRPPTTQTTSQPTAPVKSETETISPKALRLAIEGAAAKDKRAVARSFCGKKISWIGSVTQEYRRTKEKRHLSILCGQITVICLFEAMPPDVVRQMKNGEKASLEGMISSVEVRENGKIELMLQVSAITQNQPGVIT